MEKACALCGNISVLETSHIIPKFVFKHLKKDSFTGRMRISVEPNKAVQDGEKMELLCGTCEDKFQKLETHFSNKVFRPYKLDKITEFKYEESIIHDFITSVNWRILYVELRDIINSPEVRLESGFNDKQLSTLYKAEEIMRTYLMGERKDLYDIENHLFFSDTVVRKIVFDKGLPSLVDGAVQGYVVGSADRKSLYVFTNLLGVYIVTILKKTKKEVWKNTIIKRDSGKIKEPQTVKSDLIIEELSYASFQAEKAKQNLSLNQQQQIIEKIKANPEGFMKSGSFRRLKDRIYN